VEKDHKVVALRGMLYFQSRGELIKVTSGGSECEWASG
jgi:hypothetical protein